MRLMVLKGERERERGGGKERGGGEERGEGGQGMKRETGKMIEM